MRGATDLAQRYEEQKVAHEIEAHGLVEEQKVAHEVEAHGLVEAEDVEGANCQMAELRCWN